MSLIMLINEMGHPVTGIVNSPFVTTDIAGSLVEHRPLVGSRDCLLYGLGLFRIIFSSSG